jgi:O-antigen/teichoic acid export membrane protein
MRQLSKQGLSYSLAGAAMLVAMILLLPLVDTTAALSPGVRILAYAVVFIPVPLLLHGFFVGVGRLRDVAAFDFRRRVRRFGLFVGARRPFRVPR